MKDDDTDLILMQDMLECNLSLNQLWRTIDDSEEIKSNSIPRVAVIGYFSWRNTHGLRESSTDALRIIQITTVMVVVLLVWSAFTLSCGRAAMA